ncbi:MAG TPA: MerR family transcriptional regulator, partial [Candidatus Limnocylindria bacterium]|nr:MerR family transcriptional regulator [Candidatus Limnocylindria bacterium]
MTATRAAAHAVAVHPGREGDFRTYRIGEAARLVDTSPSALRSWERQGLVRPRRTRSGYRLYTDSDLAVLRRVRHMRSERVSAPGIRRLIAATPGGTTDGEARRRRLDGRRVRSLRLEQGLSLREAAARTGLSVSFLSAVERDASGVSVASLQRLTAAYGVTLLDLFSPATVGQLVRPAQRRVLELQGGVRIEQLAS